MARIAVFGAGVSGLTAAWLLGRVHEVHVFEREDRVGGHTHTHALEDGTRVDTGFIVHNRATYPLFIRLMDELGVETAPSDMSFAYHGPDQVWCSRGLNGVLARRSNLLSRRYWAFWREVVRFNALGRRLLASGALEEPLGAWLGREGFSEDFRRWYLLPMAGAVWSTSPLEMEAFPAATLLRFFENHGFLGLTTQHPWRTIPGGTSRYLEPLCRPFRDRIRTGLQDLEVRRAGPGVQVRIPGEEPQAFDQAVFACHGDQVLPLLPDADALEREVLGSFRSHRNETLLHTDRALLPPARRGWASWNAREAGPSQLRVTYHMNRLQPLGRREDLFVSLNEADAVDPAQVLRRMAYEHPRYDLAALRAQGRWDEVSGRRAVHFAGAYWRYGFHEDGVWSGVRVARALGVDW